MDRSQKRILMAKVIGEYIVSLRRESWRCFPVCRSVPCAGLKRDRLTLIFVLWLRY